MHPEVDKKPLRMLSFHVTRFRIDGASPVETLTREQVP